ncbi:MAG TPA: type II secretion system major pseudopilin GspG [Thermodesulfobacteriota bacterium]|nr:type II secretion system major pseudopilin GspG [Deltaproteobacteria bacterium]HNR13166.1 type II secretion system major pseudopilin GspG [Thermodesulfobacteriota bacterium]HNU71680.1 type II secretion system major pseudopilin GspG [Thermodesulfobacteriota bacterium]HOC39575.1 type II secretion system major pseudopilin GspG [Thermodesulfobacteriota bacterium]
MKDDRHKKRNSGFTLIELLMVMAIIGLLAALVGPRLMNKFSGAKQQAAQAQISNLSSALDAYRLDMGRYPASDEGLQALRMAPEGSDAWDGPYLQKQIPLDPWRHEYLYRCPGDHGEFDIISFGADGKEGGEGEDQDVVSWKGLNEIDEGS